MKRCREASVSQIDVVSDVTMLKLVAFHGQSPRIPGAFTAFHQL
jgi:hypothetical protein